VYEALRQSQQRCAEAILDVRKDIRTRLGDERFPDGTAAWEVEWAEEVDGLLARDAGWGWGGFWTCVRDNIKVSRGKEDREALLRYADPSPRHHLQHQSSHPPSMNATRSSASFSTSTRRPRNTAF
jgi:hypothetical protein